MDNRTLSVVRSLGDLLTHKRYATYNELSHMTPYYLTPDLHRPLDLESELLFHKRNIYLPALTFDHIVICTDNIAAFTRFASAISSSASSLPSMNARKIC
jgi:hypothetical protein